TVFCTPSLHDALPICVQRLVEVGPWHRDVVLEAAGDRMPYLMDDAECAIATADRISDDAESQQVVDLIQRSLLALDFLVDGVKRSEEHTSELQSPDHL